MVNIDDRTVYTNNRIDFWACDCIKEPEYMYSVDGEYGTTLSDFWKNYNRFPLKVIHNFVREVDDLDDDDKRLRYRIDEVHSMDELDSILDDVGWKLTLDDFFITNSSKEIRFKIQDRDELKGKVSIQYPIFELGPSDTLIEVILHGYSFLVATNDANLSTKEQVKKIVLL
ncbi:hypothetical protein [Priestia abyssalis]|uniref:hypothetical protein n=1 Tax=Priestia abyssalis TaxID=1221450 RepID=UPI000994B970|nr:hypothetical protein [Priestia abyssalis]